MPRCECATTEACERTSERASHTRRRSRLRLSRTRTPRDAVKEKTSSSAAVAGHALSRWGVPATGSTRRPDNPGLRNRPSLLTTLVIRPDLDAAAVKFAVISGGEIDLPLRGNEAMRGWVGRDGV